jgi:hypothetical protein
MDRNGQKWTEMAKIDRDRQKMDRNGQNRQKSTKMARNGPKLPEIAGNGQNNETFCCISANYLTVG